MQAIPLHRIAVVLPFTRFLSENGAPIERGFRQAGLPVGALDHVNRYVPTEKFWSFAGGMARREGIEDLGFRVGQRFGADCADPNMRSILSQSPTLYHAIVKTSELVKKTISRSRIGLIQRPHSDSAHFFHQPSFGAEHPSIDQMDWFGLMALIGIVRLYTGQDWQPSQIGLTTRHVPCRSILEQLPDTRILTSQRYAYVNLESTLLSLPLSLHLTAASAPAFGESVSTNFAGSLKQVMKTYVQECDLAIDFAAELCNTSTRSLQRKLSNANTRYSEVVDQVRFDVASDMLQDADVTVTDVAHSLGYSDSAHFSRAFRRIAGVNPRAYRQQSTQ